MSNLSNDKTKESKLWWENVEAMKKLEANAVLPAKHGKELEKSVKMYFTSRIAPTFNKGQLKH